MTFLGSVPLFKKQLPTSELPKVAQMLEEKTWKPDEKLVSQGGDLGGSSNGAFFGWFFQGQDEGSKILWKFRCEVIVGDYEVMKC